MQANLVYDHSSTPAQVIQFLHAALFSLATYKTTSQHGLDSQPETSDNTYQNPWPQPRATLINNAKTYEPQNPTLKMMISR